jgi:hypothetical protein
MKWKKIIVIYSRQYFDIRLERKKNHKHQTGWIMPENLLQEHINFRYRNGTVVRQVPGLYKMFHYMETKGRCKSRHRHWLICSKFKGAKYIFLNFLETPIKGMDRFYFLSNLKTSVFELTPYVEVKDYRYLWRHTFKERSIGRNY